MCYRRIPNGWQLFFVGDFPKGIFLIHEQLQACFLFRAAQIPRLVGFICGLRLMSSGLALGFALLRKRRMGWLGVTHKALKS